MVGGGGEGKVPLGHCQIRGGEPNRVISLSIMKGRQTHHRGKDKGLGSGS